MTIEVNWYNRDQTIIRWTFSPNWDWDAFDEAQQRSNTMIGQVNQAVDAIWDIRNSPNLPDGFIFGFKQTIKRHSARLGTIVLVGANIYVSQMFGSVISTFPEEAGRFRFTKSIDEARLTIENRLSESSY